MLSPLRSIYPGANRTRRSTSTAPLPWESQRCVALEDSVNGMIASKAARMRSIVVPEAENSRDPRFALADVKLPSLLALTAENLLG
mgnify:CR=1 FL=1